MASNDLDLNNIGFQNLLRSKTIRNNFSNIENEFNALRAEVQATVSSTASEVTAARDNQGSLSDNIHMRRIYENGISATTDFKSSIGTTGLTLRVEAGNAIVNGVGVDISARVSATTGVSASGKHRIDLVIMDTTNNISISKGSEVALATAVVYPAVSSTEDVLHSYIISDTTSTLSITDERERLLNPYKDSSYNDAFFAYNGATISTATIQDSKGVQRFYKYNFTGDTISSVGVSIDGVRYVSTFFFTGDTISTITETIG